MSDEFEDISVDVSVDVAPVEAIEAPLVDSMPVAEQPDADQKTFDNSTKIGSAEDVIRQDMAEENGTAIENGGVEGRAAVSLAGIAAKEEEKEEKRAQAFEHSQEEIKRSEARREFMNKEHDFGDMKMSGADLEKLMNFMSNPQMQDKLRERLGKSGVPKEKVDKGMKELNEYAELKKKEKDGTLTEDQQRRLKEINQSEEFKVVTQEAVSLANANNLGINVSKNEAGAKKVAALEGTSSNNVDDLVSRRIEAEAEQVRSQKPVNWSAASSRDELPKTVELTSLYNDKSSGLVAANTSDPVVKPQVAANTQIPNSVTVAKIEASNNAFM